MPALAGGHYVERIAVEPRLFRRSLDPRYLKPRLTG